MMRKILVLCGALVYGVVAADECAQEDCVESNFEGVSASAGIGFSNLKLKSNSSSDKVNAKLNSFVGEIGASYRHNIWNEWLLGLGADIEFAKKKKTYKEELTLVASATADGDVRANQAKLNAGDAKYNLDGKEIDAVVNDKIVTEKKARRYNITPELYISCGKTFCEDRLLPELLLGVSHTGWKYTKKVDRIAAADSRVTNHGNQSTKNRKVAPFVGLKASYAINGNLSVYTLVKYKFDTKKNNIKMKDKYSFNAGLSWKF